MPFRWRTWHWSARWFISTCVSLNEIGAVRIPTLRHGLRACASAPVCGQRWPVRRSKVVRELALRTKMALCGAPFWFHEKQKSFMNQSICGLE
jgi:hypothetical protein